MSSRFAVITGASQGIGEELSRVLASRGYSLILVARSKTKLSSLADELSKTYGIKTLFLDCDLSTEAGVAQLSQFCSEHLSEIEVLINNAGFGDLGDFDRQKWEVFKQMVGLNVSALTELTHFFARHFKEKKKGAILNVASTAAFQPDPYFAVYGATKAYVLSFSEALKEELAPYQVKVSVLCPGPTKTPFHERAGTDQSPFVTRYMTSVEQVAREGVDGLFQGKTVIIPGLLNRFLVFTIRLSPRAAVAKLASWMLRPKKISRAALVYLLLVNSLLAQSAPKANKEEPFLVFDFSQTRSFGGTQLGVTKKIKLKLINQGQVPLQLKKDFKQEGNAELFSLDFGACKGVLKPEKFCEVTIAFKPKVEGAFLHRFVLSYVGVKGNLRKELDLDVEGRGVPKACLVSSFGVGGIVESPISLNKAVGSRKIITFDKQGRIYTPSNPRREGVAWARFSPNGAIEVNTGSPDRRTGDGSLIPLLISPLSETRVLSAWLLSYFWSSLSVAVSTATGELDGKFAEEVTKSPRTLPVMSNHAGLVNMGMIPVLEEGESDVNATLSVSRLQEGGMIVAGKFYSISDRQKQRFEEIPKMPLLMKILPTGVLDSAFGENGIAKIENVEDKIVGLEVLPDGKVIVLHFGLKQSPGVVQLSRYLADGKRDASFGKSGALSVSDTAGRFFPGTLSLAVDSQGRIFVAGIINSEKEENEPNRSICVLKYQDQLDTSFGKSGVSCISTQELYFRERASSISILPLSTGELLVGFNEKLQGQIRFLLPQARVARILPNGQLDTSFGRAGKANFDCVSAESELSDLVMRPDGKVLMVTQAALNNRMGLLLYDPAEKCSQGSPGSN